MVKSGHEYCPRYNEEEGNGGHDAVASDDAPIADHVPEPVSHSCYFVRERSLSILRQPYHCIVLLQDLSLANWAAERYFLMNPKFRHPQTWCRLCIDRSRAEKGYLLTWLRRYKGGVNSRKDDVESACLGISKLWKFRGTGTNSCKGYLECASRKQKQRIGLSVVTSWQC